jgi:tetratricopeptide (TPR) repeat protein
MGNFRQSIDSLTEGIRLAPENPNGYFNRGISYVQLGDFERARDDFSNVIRLLPDDESAYYWRGICDEQAGRWDEAAADYSRFLAISQDAGARKEVEQRLNQLAADKHDRADNSTSLRSENPRRRDGLPDDSQAASPSQLKGSGRAPDLHQLITALGERAIRSTWYGSGVECYGEKAEELYDFTDQEQPIEGGELLRITSGIRQTVAGDFQARDPDADSPWLFIRAWEGTGFYVETDDPRTKKRLIASFEVVEEVEGASPPYQSLFIHV